MMNAMKQKHFVSSTMHCSWWMPPSFSWTHLTALYIFLLTTVQCALGSGQPGTWNCPVRDPYRVITEADRYMCCNMMMDWMVRSKARPSFYPTLGMRRWFQSLGMKNQMQTMRHPHNRRYTRQAPIGPIPLAPQLAVPPPFLQNFLNRNQQGVNTVSRGIDRGNNVNGASARQRANAFLLQRGANDIGNPIRLHYRKEYRTLTQEERDRFHRALNRLKNSFVDGMREYDIFVGYHRANLSPQAHFGPSFLPFHRELMFRFERALQRFDPDVSLPYWDSTRDAGLEFPEDSIMWTAEFAGNGYGDVTTGPFANWPTYFATEGKFELYRNLTFGFEERPFPTLMAEDGIPPTATRYRDITFYVDSSFELNHGKSHNWVGGQMIDLENSPGDPVFYLHHAYIDCAWEKFRQRQRDNGIDPRYDYPNDTVALGVNQTAPPGVANITSLENSHHRFSDPMSPFEITNGDGLADEYTEHFYKCSPSPIDCPCASPYMFCDRSSEPSTCRPRLRVGAKCTRYMMMEACYNSLCCYIDGSESEAVCRSFCPPYSRPSGAPGSVSTTPIPDMSTTQVSNTPPTTGPLSTTTTTTTTTPTPVPTTTTTHRTTSIITRPPRPSAQDPQSNNNIQVSARPVPFRQPIRNNPGINPFALPGFRRAVNSPFAPIRIPPGNLFARGPFLPFPFRISQPPSFVSGGIDARADEESVNRRRLLNNT